MWRARGSYEPDPDTPVSEEMQERPTSLYQALFLARMYYAEVDGAEHLVEQLDAALELIQQKMIEKGCGYDGLEDKDVAKILNESDIGIDIPTQGGEFYTFIIGDDVIRIAQHEDASKKIASEVAILEYLSQAKDDGKIDANIPQVIDYEPAYHIMRISKVLGNPMNVTHLSKEEQLVAGRQIGKFLGQLHSLRVDFESSKEQSDYQKLIFQDAREKIEHRLKTETDPQTRQQLEDTLEFIYNYEVDDDDLVPVHGDFNPGNTLFDPTTGKISVIDFQPGRSGDRYEDFIYLVFNYDGDVLEEIYTAYEEETGIILDQKKLKAFKTIIEHFYDYELDQNRSLQLNHN